MRKGILTLAVMVCFSGSVLADIFGSGDNQFEIEFVPISGATNPTSGYGIVNKDYRMGTYEITNDQWNKFKANIAPTQVTGDPSSAYEENPRWTGTNIPTTNVSWYEAAQFVNWLNSFHGHQTAYKFTGTKGTNNYSLGAWSAENAWNGTNHYRHKEAYYFLPTEDEWVKAAYWNGRNLQQFATVGGFSPTLGVDTNCAYAIGQPWNVDDGIKELNGTYNMMGNVREWMESPWSSGDYYPGSSRGVRSSSYVNDGIDIRSSFRSLDSPYYEGNDTSFRVASIPEPASLILLSLCGLTLGYRKY